MPFPYGYKKRLKQFTPPARTYGEVRGGGLGYTPPPTITYLAPFKSPKPTPQFALEAINYGTLEADTGLKWIDGRVIYRKGFSVGALANTGSTSDAHYIKNLHHVINTSGFATDGTTSYQLPYASPTAADCIAIYVNATNIVITTGKDLTGLTGYVVLDYTKD